MIFKKKELDKIANISRKRNVMIELTEDGKCIRIYPEFDSRTDIEPPEESEPFDDFVI
ncbi:hypothetical protein HUT03_02280 [Candidatus Liberibacter africanus]|uniref:Uncharacterized protein n=1 Tax=Candidatus Liberibacter africanus PTSAPSY TaxID=1277257 RepID=A0A0G3I4D3_LIBAF|nr:hypothetical protein [Candidatus Liberibacter africanus]AKK20095.1 hypothetical protein G293_02315 [Candidatus Liberibacter africanus PTSAPSY]QTP63908.1 hypothetical protein HUT03_02280 [Candidatus Liberibacter africanus]